MSRAAPITAALIAIWALVIGITFVGLEPSATLRGAPLLPALAGVTAAVTAALACLGGGAAVLARWQPGALDDPLGWVRALATGLVLWGLLSLPAALLLGVHPLTGVATLAMLAAGWLARPRVALPRPTPGQWAWGLVFLTPAVLTLLAPLTDTDELYYHLALPARLLDEGRLLGGPWMPNGSRPLALHLPWTWLLALGGAVAPRAFHLLLTAATLLAVQERATAWWGRDAGRLAPLLLLGSTSFLSTAGLAYADIPTALLVLVAADAGLALPLLLALATGGALAVKYTAVIAIVPIFALLGLRAVRGPDGGRMLGRLALVGLAALACVAPWWIRNLLEGLHPLFPFAGWQDVGPFVFQHPEKYGMGRGWLATLLLPWNLTMHAEHDSMVFLGRVSPAFLALAPAALWAAWRDPRARLLVAITALGLALWAAGSQWLRYLVPLLPIAALAAAAGLGRLPRWTRWAVLACWLAGLPGNLRPILARAADQAPVALGLEERDAYLARTLTAWPAVRWINEHSPEDTRVALLFDWHAGLLERPWVLGSVEDHVPTRHLLASHGARSLQVLRQAGVTHVLTSQVNFLRKSYPFLDAETFATQYQQPERMLQGLLDREGALVFEQGRHAVYRLPPPRADSLSEPAP